MKRMRATLSLFAVLLPALSQAFIGYNPSVHPALEDWSVLSTDQTVKFRFDLGLNDPHLPRLALNGPTIQLQDDSQTSKLPMPGHEQVYRKVSAGQKALQVLEPASFIGLNGLETVHLEQGSWEMMWIEESYSGRLICGFDLPIPIHRNGITFEPGTMYLSFNCYSPETLAAAQAFKQMTQQKSIHLLNEKEEYMQLMKEATNPLAKAVHYQRAFAAFDKLLALPAWSHIPDMEDVVQLANGLFLVKEGVVWKKLNVMFGPNTQSLGKVVLSVEDSEEGFKSTPEINDKLKP